MLQDLEDNHRHFFLLSFQAGFSPMLLCSLRLPPTAATGHQAWGSQLSHQTAKICFRQWGGKPLKHHPPRPPRHQELASHHESILRSGPWGLRKRFQKAEPLLSAFTSIYLGEKPSSQERYLYLPPLPSHHGNARVSEEACNTADEMPPIKAF